MSKAKWILDQAHCLAEFSVKHMMIATVKGRFGGIEGVVYADPADLTTAEFDVKVDAATVDTREPQRDAHLRSADFFDVENSPHLTFKSKRVEAEGGGEYTLVGDLTMRGVTHEVAFRLHFDGQGKDPWGNQRIALNAETTVNRKDYGLNWNTALEAGGFLVSDLVKIFVQIEAIQQN